MLSILVTAYLPKSRPYLDLCMQSIEHASLEGAGDVEVLIVAPKSYAPKYAKATTISPPEEHYHNPRALNFGIEQARGDVLLVLNDDVILTKNSIGHMLEVSKFAPTAIVMPMGNDQQNAYHLQVPHVMSGPLPRDGRCPAGHVLMNAESLYPPGIILPDTLCMYAFMMHRKFHYEVGPFDENLKTGFDDTDYCLRAKLKGGVLAISMASLVYHFGGVSADSTLTPEIRSSNEKYFRQKWNV